MSIDHDYAFANSSQKSGIQGRSNQLTTNSSPGVNSTEPQPRVYRVQKMSGGQQIVIPHGQQLNLAEGGVRMVQREIHRGGPGGRGISHHQGTQQRQEYNVMSPNSHGIGGTIAGRPYQTTNVRQTSNNTVFTGQQQQQPQVQHQVVLPNHQRPAGQNGTPQTYVMVQNEQHRQIRYVSTGANHGQQQQQHQQVFVQGGGGNQQNVRQVVYASRTTAVPMNLAVPLREPSPEPAPVVVAEEPEQKVNESQSTSNEEEPMPSSGDGIDIQIRNVVCNYTLPLHIDLRKLAMHTNNVTYEREKGVMMKQKRNPSCYIKVYSSGKVYIVGCRSEIDCRKAARSVARHVQKVMGKTSQKVSIRNYRVNNVLATCRLPFGINIEGVARKFPSESTYEQELSVGLVWKSKEPKATLRIHTTGSITVTGASSEADVITVIEKIYPIVLEFRSQSRSKNAIEAKKRKRRANVQRAPPAKRERLDKNNYGSSGVINNKVYFSDEEDEDLIDYLDLDE